jgi:hypothetical protein
MGAILRSAAAAIRGGRSCLRRSASMNSSADLCRPARASVPALDTIDSFLLIPVLRIEERRQGIIEPVARVLAAPPRKFFQLGVAFGLERNGVHISNLVLS